MSNRTTKSTDDAPDSRRGMCGSDCGGIPCARDKGHAHPCSPNGDTAAQALTAIVRARMAALGLTQATLARRMVHRWGGVPDSAVATLSRWFNREPGGKGDMTTDKLAELLAELGLVVVPSDS